MHGQKSDLVIIMKKKPSLDRNKTHKKCDDFQFNESQTFDFLACFEWKDHYFAWLKIRKQWYYKTKNVNM